MTLQFIGQSGETNLAAVGLGISFCNIFGYCIIMGLDTATATLCSQSYGAKNLRRYGIVFQRAMIMQLMTAVCLLIFWINAEHVLILLQQQKEIARIASTYILWRSPSLILIAIFRNLKTYLMCQKIVLPLVLIGVISIAFCLVCNVVLVNILKFGVIGSSISIDLTYLFVCLLTLFYIKCRKIHKTWPGWSWECLSQWGQFGGLALPGALMIFFDWATGECGIFLSGILGETQLAAQSVIASLLGLTFMAPLGISAAASVNVGNFLGAAEPAKAINVAKSALFLTWAVGLTFSITMLAAKDYIGYAFTSSKTVVKMIARVLPLMSGFHLLDCTQGVSAGILRGAGLQKYGATANFIGLDLIGLPVGAVFALVLRWDLLGYWSGLTIGLFIQSVMLLLILSCKNWSKLAVKARARALSSSALSLHKDEIAGDNIELVEVAGSHMIRSNGEVPDTDEHEDAMEKVDEIIGTAMSEQQHDLEELDLQIKIAEKTIEITPLRKVVHVFLIILIPSIVLTISILIRILL